MRVSVALMVGLLALLSQPLHSRCEAVEYPVADSSSKTTLPRFGELHDRARELLRRESWAKTASQGVLPTLAIIQLANELRDDPRYETSPTLQEMRGRLTARLRTVKKQMLATHRRKKRPEKIKISNTALAQVNAAFNARQGGANVNQANLGAGPTDFGPRLVALIQDTISPQSWDVNGGSSTIRYWRPGMALVVRAPHGLHEQVRPVLGQLRGN